MKKRRGGVGYVGINHYICSNLCNPITMKNRVAAIDVLRSITMFLMLFVNDIPGLKGVPGWLFHAKADQDMLGFSDIIFPAFLFCVGMSVPFALENRFKKGENYLQVITHILIRTFSLVVMGLFTLNCSEHGVISGSWFMLLMAIGFILTWLDAPALAQHRGIYSALKWAGVLLLAGLLIYSDVSGKPFQTGWWGILGLIGWTYLVVSLAYLFTRKNLTANGVVCAVSILLCVLNQSSLIPEEYFSRNVLLPFIPGGWTHHALGMSGLMTSLVMKYLAQQKNGHRTLILTLLLTGFCSCLLGVACHHFWIVSKIQATPTWLFYCMAIYFVSLALIFYITDVKGKNSWFQWLKPAGVATLTCYILPYVWYALKDILGLFLPEGVYFGWVGILISLLYSYLIILIVKYLLELGVKIKV